MIWAFFAVVALGLVAVFAGLVTSRLPYDPMSAPTMTANDPGLPDTVHARDVDGVRFDYALRGYRMDQVDEVLDRLRNRLAEQETELDRWRREPALAQTSTPDAARAEALLPDPAPADESPLPDHAPAESPLPDHAPAESPLPDPAPADSREG